MSDCRCPVINVLSGAIARDYVDSHLQPDRRDGLGRLVLRCPDLGHRWVEERSPGGYGQDVTVLRRSER